jgi:ABC-2 type transport system ATP-binding protein
MIDAENVAKSFGHIRAVQGLSFRVSPGEVVGLLGPNGAGKSTTIRMLTGFLPPDSGAVRVLGHDTLNDSLAARAGLGYLPDAAPLYDEMRADDYLDYRGRLFAMPRSARRQAVARSIDRCRLHDVRRRRLGALSKGYRQRVGLAAAILHDPPVLILDEPTSGLDPTQVLLVRALVRELSDRRTVLISSHMLVEVEQTCGRVIVIAGGRIRADGPPRALAQGHAGPAVYHLHAAGPDAQRLAQDLAALPGVTGVDAAAPDGEFHRWTIRAAPGSTGLLEPIGRLVCGRGLVVRELRRDEPSLEQVFHRLIAQDPQP